MKYRLSIKYLPILLVSCVFADHRDDAQLKKLEADCENARQEKIKPLKDKTIAQCINKKNKDPSYCERRFKSYGSATKNRPALFYDLPECVASYEYRKKPHS